jgi:hypothetical protein
MTGLKCGGVGARRSPILMEGRDGRMPCTKAEALLGPLTLCMPAQSQQLCLNKECTGMMSACHTSS